jgi:WD40 repeat protein
LTIASGTNPSFVAFTPDGKRLATTYAKHTGTIALWDLGTGQEIRTFPTEGGAYVTAAFSPDGKYLATANTGGAKIRLWDTESGEQTAAFEAGWGGDEQTAAIEAGWGRTVHSLAFSPDGKWLAGVVAGMVRLWDLARLPLANPLTFKAKKLALSADWKYVAGMWNGGRTKLWELASDREVWTSKRRSDRKGSDAITPIFSPNGQYLALRWLEGNMLRVVDAATGEQVWIVSLDVLRVLFSPDSKRVACLLRDGKVKMFDAANGRELQSPLVGLAKSPDSFIAFSPDGKRLVGRSEVLSEATGKIVRWLECKVWNAETGEELHSFKVDAGVLNNSYISPDCNYLVIVTYHVVKLWDVASGREVWTLNPKDSYVSVFFSPDSKRLACMMQGTTVTLREVATGQEILSLKGHTSGLSSMAFSPDGKRLATMSSDKTVKLWNATTGQELLTLKGLVSVPGVAVAFSPDSKRLAIHTPDQKTGEWTLRILDASQSMKEAPPK